MITFGLGGLTLITMGLGITWIAPSRPQIIKPSMPVDIETIVFTNIDEEIQFEEH